jgi:tripartite-type tricarboxylate transporter receptor subunit TctC
MALAYPSNGYDDINIYDYMLMTKYGNVKVHRGLAVTQTQEALVITRRNCVFGLAAAGLGLQTGPAWTQDFPARPVRLIVALTPGTSSDVCLRALAAATEQYLGRPIIIENRPGASTTLGPSQMAASARPDGYTLSQITQTVFRVPFMRATTYDPTKDFTYILAVTAFTVGVVVRSDAPWQTFEEFLVDAKANPGKISFGTGGAGTTSHVVMELIGRQRDIKWFHVPFRGGDATNALLGGHIQAEADPAAWAPFVNSGQLRLLVTFGDRRTGNWPKVPTLKEVGIDLTMSAPYGIAGPKGMEPKIIKALHDAFKKGMEEPSFITAIAQFDQEPFYLSTADYHDFAMRQIANEKRVVEELGLKDE